MTGATRPWLVVGGGGLVGQHLVRALRGRSILVTHRRDGPRGSMSLDITDDAAVDRLVASVRPAVVAIAAAEAFVERCEIEPEATRRVNVDGTAAITEAARRCGALVVFFSSEYVFDGSHSECSEDDPVAPINEYGRQKAAAESIVSRGDHLICRTSGVFGWEAARKNFVCQVVDTLRAGREMRVPSEQLITPTAAEELARAVVTLVDRGARGTYHVAGPRILERVRFAEAIAGAFRLRAGLLRLTATSDLGLRAARPRCGLRTERLVALLGPTMSPPEVALAAMRDAEPILAC